MPEDYYASLNVTPEATAEEIKQAYRKRAFELHPDRHGGSRQAEEAFKKLTAAYAVLGDAERRRAYDASRTGTGPAGPQFDPGDSFRGLFDDPAFRSLFEEMSREFARQGLRFDEAYVRRVFRHSRGPLVFGGVFFAGPLSGLFDSLLGGTQRPDPVQQATRPQALGNERPGWLHRLLQLGLPRADAAGEAAPALDAHYRLPVAEEILQRGGEVRVRLPGPGGSHTYRVRVPAHATPGTRLRLAGKGRRQGDRNGDLYLEIQLRT